MNSQKIYIVEYSNRTIGLWNSYELAKTFIMGCYQNRLMNLSANIKTYNVNTCYCLKTEPINLISEKIEAKEIESNEIKAKEIESNEIKAKEIESNEIKAKEIESNEIKAKEIESNEIKAGEIDIKNPTYIEMNNQKIKLQHEINLLNQQKKKIEESKTTYENDYNLFKLFTENKQKDSTFVIPDIFIKKFNLMTELNSNNNLSWESFIKEYQHDNIYNEYFGLNSYENIFINSDTESNINEEIYIQSDSITVSSDSDNNNKLQIYSNCDSDNSL